MDILKLIDNIEEIAAKNSFNNNQEDIDESLRDKRSNSL